MGRLEFLKKLKEILGSGEGCTTKTTPKKGDGFVPYNYFNIKWGQVDADVEKNHIRLVFDLKQGYLSEANFRERTGLSVTPLRKITTGYRFTKTVDKHLHDQLIMFLEDDYLRVQTDKLNEILLCIQEFVSQSKFKSKPSRS